MTIASIIASSGVTLYPSRAMDFEASIGSGLQLQDTDLGAYNRAKFGTNVWLNMESFAANRTIFAKGNDAGSSEFVIRVGSGGLVTADFYSSAGNIGGSATSVTALSLGSYAMLTVLYDRANATSADRIQVLINGVRDSVTGYIAPSSNVYTNTNNLAVGQTATGTNYYDGLMYQVSMYSTTLPDAGSLISSGHAKDVRYVGGLYSLIGETIMGGDYDDFVRSGNWSAGNITPSTNIP